jgi:two-component system, NarL family, response regulator
MANDKIRILIADDHHLVRDGLGAIINMEPDMKVVAEAANGDQAVELYGTKKPDIALLDLRMPIKSGLEALIEIRKEFTNARIIMLTSYDGDEDVHQSFQAGAYGYLLKDMLRRDLLHAIRLVHSGQRHIPPSIAARLAERLSLSELTEREITILNLIAKGKTNKEIGATLGIAEITTKVHVSNILLKLGVGDRTEAVTVALRRGIIHLH